MAGGSPRPDDMHGRLWLAEAMWRIGCIQFGEFSLGRTVRDSPVYINPKLLVSRPDVLVRLAALIEDELQTAMAMRNRQVEPFDLVAGVPVGGLHIATALSLRMLVPMVYTRPPREYRPFDPPAIEGVWRPNQTALVVDDLAAGGGSLVDTVLALRSRDIVVRDAVVVIDREQGALGRLEDLGVRLHPVLTLHALITYLHETGHVDRQDYRRTVEYLRDKGELRSEFD